MLELILYHGNTESAVDQIVASQTLPVHLMSTGDGHYLGDGYYFYQDIEQAKIWSIMKVTRKEKYRNDAWAVLRSTVRFAEGKYMDLDSREHQDFFFKEMMRLREVIHSQHLKVEQYSDSYMCNHLARILGLDIIAKTFAYKNKHEAYPPLFSNERSRPYGITRHFRTEKQYCVRNSAVAVTLEKVMRGDNPQKRGAML